MKKKLSKMVALGLCGLLVLQGSIAPAMAEEKAPEETVYEEVADNTEHRSMWISTVTDYCPSDSDIYDEVESGSGSIDLTTDNGDLTLMAAESAVVSAIMLLVPEAGITGIVMGSIIGLTPNMVVDAFEKYAPIKAELDYEYYKYKNLTDSTIMEEYYYYEVYYYLDGHPVNEDDKPVTFYEIRTFI